MKKLSPYQRIILAAKLGFGVHLSADEVFGMSQDTAMVQVAENDDEARNDDEDNKEKEI